MASLDRWCALHLHRCSESVAQHLTRDGWINRACHDLYCGHSVLAGCAKRLKLASGMRSKDTFSLSGLDSPGGFSLAWSSVRRCLRRALTSAFFMCTLVASARGPDSEMLRQGLDAYERVNITKTPRKGDAGDAAAIVGFIGGVIAAHRDNNAMAAMMTSDATTASTKKTVRLFAPLRNLPPNVSVEAIIFLTRKYMAEHPDRLNQSANGIITSALQAEFAQ